MKDSPAHAATLNSTVSQKVSEAKRTQQCLPWSTYPALHANVSRLLGVDNLSFRFHEEDEPHGSTNEYDTTVMGRFICENDSCSSDGWSSKKIAITIRMYLGTEYNARVYNQRCRFCDRLSRPTLDNSYEERIAYRLKKWCGVPMDLPYYSGQSEGPHQSNLCEGCRNGHCSKQV